MVEKWSKSRNFGGFCDVITQIVTSSTWNLVHCLLLSRSTTGENFKVRAFLEAEILGGRGRNARGIIRAKTCEGLTNIIYKKICIKSLPGHGGGQARQTQHDTSYAQRFACRDKKTYNLIKRAVTWMVLAGFVANGWCCLQIQKAE